MGGGWSEKLILDASALNCVQSARRRRGPLLLNFHDFHGFHNPRDGPARHVSGTRLGREIIVKSWKIMTM